MNPDKRLTRLLCYALRHNPRSFGVEADRHGWVPLDGLVEGLRGSSAEWASLSAAQVQQLVHSCALQRFEIHDGRIRARYGHTIRVSPNYPPEEPPPVLFHATTLEGLIGIRLAALFPMTRTYVHLTSDISYALRLHRKDGARIILVIAARDAHSKGVSFWRATRIVWLSDPLSNRFISNATVGKRWDVKSAVPLGVPATSIPGFEEMGRTLANLYEIS